jgi:hypothetical protein
MTFTELQDKVNRLEAENKKLREEMSFFKRVQGMGSIVLGATLRVDKSVSISEILNKISALESRVTALE